tara:strand:+ start:576 stop:815 length:240 start_codon:yes stop_codon:yes gene_type:complete
MIKINRAASNAFARSVVPRSLCQPLLQQKERIMYIIFVGKPVMRNGKPNINNQKGSKMNSKKLEQINPALDLMSLFSGK